MSGSRFRNDVPEWVQQQHKTMLRWINSKLATELTDLSTDLCDGVVLIQLINKIISEMDLEASDLKLYLLKPLYTKPKMMLQKMENINDFLEFIRIVLKINVTSISSDNILDGNLKLILGLIWTLFIFSTTSSIGLMNDGNSLVQIKQILLNWINSKYKMSQVSNFDRDWSLDINCPDTIFHSILKSYLPSSDVIKLTESKFQNMKLILQFSEDLGIPRLADIEDFKNLVPDEKCILFYILEWFKHFELGNFDVSSPQDEEVSVEQETKGATYDEVVIQMAEIIKSKLEFETKALRFSNKVLTTSKKLDKYSKRLGFEVDDLLPLLSKYRSVIRNFTEADNAGSLDQNEELKEVISLFGIKSNVIIGNLQGYKESVHTTIDLSETELSVLKDVYREGSTALASFNEDLKFEVSRSLSIDTLEVKLQSLVKEEKQQADKVEECNKRILSHKLILEASQLLMDKGIKDPFLLHGLERLNDFINTISEFTKPLSSQNDQPTGSTAGGSSNSKTDKIGGSYHKFKEEIFQFDSKFISNEVEFTLILESLTSDNLNPSYIKQLINFVPTKTVNLNFNDSDFSLVLESEDEDSEIDNSRLIFENQRRKIGSYLCHEKVYDLVEFFDKFEHGLKF